MSIHRGNNSLGIVSFLAIGEDRLHIFRLREEVAPTESDAALKLPELRALSESAVELPFLRIIRVSSTLIGHCMDFACSEGEAHDLDFEEPEPFRRAWDQLRIRADLIERTRPASLSEALTAPSLLSLLVAGLGAVIHRIAQPSILPVRDDRRVVNSVLKSFAQSLGPTGVRILFGLMLAGSLGWLLHRALRPPQIETLERPEGQDVLESS